MQCARTAGGGEGGVTGSEMAKQSTAFPVGLYGMLLFALAWLTLPRVFGPIERWCVGAACVVPRLWAAWFGDPALAADTRAFARIAVLGDDLERRIARHDLAGAGVVLPVGDEAVSCGVLSVGRRGGGGEPCELLLDRSYRQLRGCRELVTKGGALLGFLLQPGAGAAADDAPDDPARVVLCNHRDAPRLCCGIDLPDGGQLRFVVRAAASVDPAPLCVDLWDDPYRAARLDRAGQAVFTLPVSFGPQRVPGGLALGRTRIWGYAGDGGGEPLTIGVYVVPPYEPRALSHVVCWRAFDAPAEADAAAPPPAKPRAHRRAAAVVYDLPGAARGRHLLVVPVRVPDGAAVVQGGRFLGTARGLAFGTGLVSSFVASRQHWTLLFLPDDPGEDPVELHGQVVRQDGDSALLAWRGDRERMLRLGDGHLFTGSNGPFCPAGLWIGRARPHPLQRDLLEVAVALTPGPQRAEVIVAGAAP